MTDATEAAMYHEDPERLLIALRLAESVTGFSARLIEKDYHCSVVLGDLIELFGQGLVFKGGTSLSKVHTEFFRLSEDLDFCVSINPKARRSTCRKAVEFFKAHFVNIPARHKCFRIAQPLTGHSDSRHYDGRLAYHSVVTGEAEFLKVDVGLREEVLLPPPYLPARTLLLDPDTNMAAIAPFNVRVLSLQEAYSEKIRAALTRHDPAIRDYFDVDRVVQMAILNHLAPDFLQLLVQKLSVIQDPVDTSPRRISMLKAQLEAQLKPVLRTADYEAFLAGSGSIRA